MAFGHGVLPEIKKVPQQKAEVFNIRLDTGISQLDNRIFYFQGKNIEINTDV